MKMHARLLRSFVVLTLALLVATATFPALFAQETTAGIQGTVKDQSGALVSNAAVQVSGPALIGIKSVKTDATGFYRFTNLPPGTYTLTVTVSGFRTNKLEGLKLDTGKLPTVDVSLEVGAAAEIVEVSGAQRPSWT